MQLGNVQTYRLIVYDNLSQFFCIMLGEPDFDAREKYENWLFQRTTLTVNTAISIYTMKITRKRKYVADICTQNDE